MSSVRSRDRFRETDGCKSWGVKDVAAKADRVVAELCSPRKAPVIIFSDMGIL